ncbi:hypothetical protein [Promicromonospora panici]|uniref:hypothetical protein n=1 Tax=Promicromonospora panici TaxID=2219658 RepID=UPI00101BE256|nr:hypothetical protein [Promicromonospora panici]
MNGACLPPAPSGGDPRAALATALELVARGTDQLRAAMEVEWEAPAARLYRAEVGEAVSAVARELGLLEEAMRRAAEYLAAGGPG